MIFNALRSGCVFMMTIAYDSEIVTEAGDDQFLCVGFNSEFVEKTADAVTVVSGVDHMRSDITTDMMCLSGSIFKLGRGNNNSSNGFYMFQFFSVADQVRTSCFIMKIYEF